MGIKFSSRAVRERIITAWRRQWAWLRRNHDTTQQEQEFRSGEILITYTITQETTPRVSSRRRSGDGSQETDCVLRQKLVLMAEDEFSPSGSPTGTALGIPAEHLLDESSSEIGEHIQPIPLSFDNPFTTPPRTESDDSDCGSAVLASRGTLSNEPNQPTPLSVDNPFSTPPKTDSDSSDSGSSTIHVAKETPSSGPISPSVVDPLDSGTLAVADVDSPVPNLVAGNPADGSQRNAHEPDELAGSELVHICTLCGHKSRRWRRGSTG